MVFAFHRKEFLVRLLQLKLVSRVIFHLSYDIKHHLFGRSFGLLEDVTEYAPHLVLLPAPLYNHC